MQLQLRGDKIRVFQPDGKTHARWATQDQARKLIWEGRATGMGNKRRYYALRLKVSTREYNRRLIEAGAEERIAGVPVLHGRSDPGVNAMLAPSPRTGWSWSTGVHRNKQGRTSGERDYVRNLVAQQIAMALHGR